MLITGARAPVALHIARLLNKAGCYVVLADSLKQSIGFYSKRVHATAVLPPVNGEPEPLAEAVRRLIDKHNITHVLPTCEEVFHLAKLWQCHKIRTTLLAPPFALLRSAHHKAEFISMVEGMGLNAPDTWLLTDRGDIAGLPLRPNALVLKPVWSRFGTDVHIRPNHVTVQPTVQRPWVAQTFLAGEMLCVYAFAITGKVTLMAAYQPSYCTVAGAGAAFSPVISKDVAEFVAHFVRATAWSGQVSFDFIQTENGLFPIECNPRATSGVHFFDDGPRFAAALFDGEPAVSDAKGLLGVRAAMAVTGFWPAARNRTLRQFFRDLRDVTDVLDCPDDRIGLGKILTATTALVWIALRSGVSLEKASTQDIEWNGS